MTSSLKKDQAGPAARRAREQLIEALRRLPRGAGSGSLPALAPLLFVAADSGDEPDADEELCAELIRVLGAEMGELTPTSIREAALLALRHRSSAREQAQREALTPIAGELRASIELLREIDASEVSPAVVSALHQAGRTLEAAQKMGTGYFTADGPAPNWDPLALFSELETHHTQALHRLAAALSRLHEPVRIAPSEAVQVAWSMLAAPTSHSPRAALLELVRLLGPLCARAPLSSVELHQLIELARHADLARDDPDWAKVANRLWALRSRLLGSKKPLTPLERSLAPHQANRSVGRPPTLEAILRLVD